MLALLGSAELALADADPGTKLHERIDVIQRAGLELAEIVRALQAYIREQDAPARIVSVVDSVETALALVRRVGALHDVELAVRAKSEPLVRARPGPILCSLVELTLDGLARAARGDKLRARRLRGGQRGGRLARGHGRAPARRGDSMRVLVVDDDELVRGLTVQVLERAGYDVVSAPSGDRALELVETDSIDLVVSDVVMPGLTGIDLLTELRDRRPELPVVLMTGGSPEPDRTAQALELGASAIVCKPYTHAELRKAVAEALS